MICPNCQKAIEETTEKCPHCGEALSPKKSGGKALNGILIGLAAVQLVAAGGIGAVLHQKRSEKAFENEQQQALELVQATETTTTAETTTATETETTGMAQAIKDDDGPSVSVAMTTTMTTATEQNNVVPLEDDDSRVTTGVETKVTAKTETTKKTERTVTAEMLTVDTDNSSHPDRFYLQEIKFNKENTPASGIKSVEVKISMTKNWYYSDGSSEWSTFDCFISADTNGIVEVKTYPDKYDNNLEFLTKDEITQISKSVGTILKEFLETTGIDDNGNPKYEWLDDSKYFTSRYPKSLNDDFITSAEYCTYVALNFAVNTRFSPYGDKSLKDVMTK